jgi:uncharacterized protein YndB with AHSA1/START domain
MPDQVTCSIEIDAPVEEVFAAALDPERLGEWVTIHREVCSHTMDDGPPAKGDEMVQRLSLRGAPLKVSWTLVACEAPTHAQWNGKGPARSKAETEYTLTDLGGGRTRFDYRNVFKPPLGPLGGVAARALTGGLPAREAEASLRQLKALLEAR